jgi:hypothetical protein
MTANNMEHASGSSSRRTVRRTLESWRSTTLILGALALPVLSGCGDFHLAATNLDIGPDPAVPGDMMVASFLMSLIPTQNHTIVLIIDDEEHMRIDSNEAPPIPYVIQLGDAAGLIDMYGLGAHTAYVQAHAGSEAARTAAVSFVLGADPEAEP